MEVFDNDGHIILAEAMMAKEYYLALADVEDGWDFNQEPLYDGTVGDVFGYIGEHYKVFVQEDENGTLEHKDKFYSVSETATNRIFLSFKQRGTPINERIIRQQIITTNLNPNEGMENRLWWESNEMDASLMKKVVAENISPKKINLGSSETINWMLVF